MTPDNDEVRDHILRHLHIVHIKARSARTTGIGIKQLQKALKPLGYKQQAVASNLDYLVQKGWVREVVEPRTYTTDKGTMNFIPEGDVQDFRHRALTCCKGHRSTNAPPLDRTSTSPTSEASPLLVMGTWSTRSTRPSPTRPRYPTGSA